MCVCVCVYESKRERGESDENGGADKRGLSRHSLKTCCQKTKKNEKETVHYWIGAKCSLADTHLVTTHMHTHAHAHACTHKGGRTTNKSLRERFFHHLLLQVRAEKVATVSRAEHLQGNEQQEEIFR